MKKPKPLYRKMTEEEKCLCPLCNANMMTFVTDRGIKLNYKEIRATDPTMEKLIDQYTFLRIECLNCHMRFLIDWESNPVSYIYTGGPKHENS